MADSLLSRLPPDWRDFLSRAGEVVAISGHALYLVGGAVRDLLLGRPVLDIDLVVEADASLLAPDLAEALGCRVTATSQFGTLKLEWQGRSLDLVTARSESYRRPGALPTVAPGTIADDLARRDFSINALALALHPEHYGELLDPHGGQRDLSQKLVRVLHARSFQDDATRILRALRYCARLGFQLEEQTRAWLLRDRDMLSTIGGERVFHELELIFEEEQPERALSMAQEMGVLAAIHPALRFTPEMGRWFARAREAADGEPEVYLCLLAYPLGRDEAPSVAHRLRLSVRRTQAWEHTIALREQLAEIAQPGLTPSALYRRLGCFIPTAVCAVSIGTDYEPGRERLRLYLSELRPQRTHLRGDDLIALGIPQGPEVGLRLRQLLDARLDGLAKDRADEVALVRRWAAEYSAERT